MNKYIITIIILFSIPEVIMANTGVFFGVGNQVVPIKNNNIQLVKEIVNIKLIIEEGNGKFGVPLIPWANVTAKFVLKNKVNKKVNLQIGFPFYDLQGFGDEDYVLKHLNFRVISNSVEIKTKLKEGLIEKKYDPEGYFKKVFAWQENFKPYETKIIVVRYKMLMGVSVANSDPADYLKITDEDTARKYNELEKLFPTITYSFGYITKTAYTWKGQVEEAIFTLESNDFIKQLGKPDFISGFKLTKSLLSKPIYLENISPAGYLNNNGLYEWKFNGRVPTEGLSINYIILFIPSHLSEINPFMKTISSKIKNVNIKELQAVLNQYYRYLTNNAKPTDPFVLNYFEIIKIFKKHSDFIFDTDKSNVIKISEQFNELIDAK